VEEPQRGLRLWPLGARVDAVDAKGRVVALTFDSIRLGPEGASFDFSALKAHSGLRKLIFDLPLPLNDTAIPLLVEAQIGAN